jgi:hypothetical protein
MTIELTPRRFGAPFSGEITLDWLPSSPAIAAVLDTYTVMVPANEAFYMRTINICLPKLTDPALREAAQAFIHQEAEHGVAHKRYWRNLEQQGYRFRGFERLVDRLSFRTMEKFAPLSLRLSMVSCVEHINAFVAHEFLTQDILADAHPEVRGLMEWHFAEEIEHKHIAFDVLNAVAPAYGIRLFGLLTTAPLFYAVMTFGMLRFLSQSGRLFRRSTWSQLWRHFGGGHRMLARTLGHLWAYAKPSFHPNQLDDRALAAAVIARYGSEGTDWLSPAQRGRSQEPRRPIAA